MPPDARSTEKGRHEYARKLLSQYADSARVVIASRIHSVLPASALGISVIFLRTAIFLVMEVVE